MAEVEDGEILSDEENECDKNASMQAKNPFGQYEMLGRTTSSTTSGQQFKQVRASDIHYTSEEESASDTDEDSPLKKKMMRVKPKVPHSEKGHARDTQWVKEKHRDVLKGKKPNNIWSAVLQEDNVSTFVNQLHTNENIDYTERGAESYDWTRSKLDPRYEKKDELSGSESSSASDSSEEKNDTAIDLTEMETFAAAIEKPKISIKSRLGKRKEQDNESAEEQSDEDNKSISDENRTDNITDAREKITGKVKSMETSCEIDDHSVKEKSKDNQFDARDVLKRKKTGKIKSMETTSEMENHSEREKEGPKVSKYGARDFLKSKPSEWKRGDAREDINSRKRTHKQQKYPPPFTGKMQEIMEVDLKPMKMGVSVDCTMDTALLADTILDALQEPEDKLEMFMRIVEQVGAEKTIKLFKATEDVEEMGGLMIKNRQRRRTPGGVFLFLIREDCDITNEQRSVIFGESERDFREKYREMKRERRRQMREWKREEKRQLEAEDMRESATKEPDSIKSDTNKDDQTANKGDDDMDDLELEEPNISIELA